MADQSPQDRRRWDQGDSWGVMFLLPAMFFAIKGAASPHSTGWAIGMLTLVAAAVSIRLDMKGMKGFERFGWILVFFAFTYLELKAIETNDKQNLADRQAQNERFDSITK
jgi:hypothetical protein